MPGTNGRTPGISSPLWRITMRPSDWLPRCMGGTTSMLSAIGAISPVTDMAGRLMNLPAGRLTLRECGAGIPLGVTPGFPESLGAGCHFITGSGISMPQWDGSGWRTLSMCGIQLWSIGIYGPGWIGWAPVGAAGLGGSAPCALAAAGCLTAVPTGVLRTGQPIRAGGPYC